MDSFETAMLIVFFPMGILIVVFYQILLRIFIRQIRRRREQYEIVEGTVSVVTRMQSKNGGNDVIFRIDYRYQNADYSVQQLTHSSGQIPVANQRVDLWVPVRHPERACIVSDDGRLNVMHLVAFPLITLMIAFLTFIASQG